MVGSNQPARPGSFSQLSLVTPAAREWSHGAASDIDGRAERPNGAFGKRDIEGKTAREAASELGKERVSNERERMSQSLRSLDLTPGGFPSVRRIPHLFFSHSSLACQAVVPRLRDEGWSRVTFSFDFHNFRASSVVEFNPVAHVRGQQRLAERGNPTDGVSFEIEFVDADDS